MDIDICKKKKKLRHDGYQPLEQRKKTTGKKNEQAGC